MTEDRYVVLYPGGSCGFAIASKQHSDIVVRVQLRRAQSDPFRPAYRIRIREKPIKRGAEFIGKGVLPISCAHLDLVTQ